MCASCASGCRAPFPASTFSFLPADIVSQILNFGAPAPIDVQVAGPNRDQNESLRRRAAAPARGRFPASPTCACSSPRTIPQFDVDVDRTQAGKLGITERDVTNSLATTLAGSFQTAPDLLAQPAGTACPIRS